MKKTLSIILAAATLLLSAPTSAYAVDVLSDPADQIEPSDTKPDPAEVERIIREFLQEEMHFNEAVTCGILANIYVECRFNPGDRYEESGGFTSYGICQWNRDRLQAMIDYCAEHGYEPSDVHGQLGYLKYELETTEKNAYKMIRSISNDAAGAYEAGLNWARYFERSNSAGHENRAILAKETFWPVYGRYLPVGLNVPYYQAEGDTLSAAYAMAEAYLAGYPSNDSRVSEGLAGLDLDALYTESAADLEAILAALHEGIPAILRYADGRAAIIYGYDGDSTEADPAGLRLLIPTPTESVMPGSYGRVSAEVLSASSVLIRKDLAAALPICADNVSELSLAGFAHPVGLPEDGTIRLGGRLISDETLTEVEITLTDADGKLLASGSAQPNANLYDLALLPGFAGEKLSAGDYKLTLTAKDASGSALEYSDPLTVSDLPLAGRIGESSADPLTDEDAQVPGIYRIIAQSGLRLRSEPSLDGAILTAMKYGTIVTVTEVTEDGWGKTSYGGYEGWMSMEYAEFVSTTGFLISYHANGGAGSPAAAVKSADEAIYLSDVLPSRTGYRFLGWSVNRVATVAEYEPGDPYTDNGEVTLYAVWQEIVPVYADVSGDGTVNMRDIVLLQQYLNGFDVVMDYVAADLDGDGVISMRDIVLLQQYLNEAV